MGWTSTKLGLMFLLKDTTQWRRWGSKPAAPRSRVKHSTTEPLRSPIELWPVTGIAIVVITLSVSSDI